MNIRKDNQPRIPAAIDRAGLRKKGIAKPVTVLNEELLLIDTDSRGGDPYNSASAVPLKEKRDPNMR